MKPGELESWKRTRERGMLRYVLVIGVAGIGLVMFCAIALSSYNETHRIWSLFAGAIVFSICGVLFGLFSWFVNERRFRAAIRRGEA
jgi:Na+/melibiose symporter-like transporter